MARGKRKNIVQTSVASSVNSILDLGITPHVTIVREGPDGNAFTIMANCRAVFAAVNNAARIPRSSWEPVWEGIETEMMSGDYEHLLSTCGRYFRVGEGRLKVTYEGEEASAETIQAREAATRRATRRPAAYA